MTKSDKIREYFRKHPDAVVAKVAAKFEASLPMTYKLRGQVVQEWLPPEMVPVPEDEPVPTGAPGRKVTLSKFQVAICSKLGVRLEDYVKEGLAQGVLKYDDELEPAVEESGIDETLNERAQDYGKFKEGAALMQGIKRLLADHARLHNKTFADDQWEALEMIVHKMARIVNGNPDKVDSWTDIAGYAKLVADRLQGNVR
jgi:hypothetical protein